MVYKKYIKKDGKVYGPYIYHSRRVDGKVVSEYHGVKKEFNYKKFLWIFLGILLLFVFIYGLSFFNKMSGKAVLDIDANYQEGQVLEGTMKLFLEEGELIPASSKLIFETSGQRYEYDLEKIVSNELVEGDFYVKGKSISGSGLGYGLKGKREIYPTIYFTVEVYSIGESEEKTEEESESQPPTQTEETVNEIVEEETGEEIEEIEQEIEEESEAPVTGNIVKRFFGGVSKSFLGLTGKVVMELETEVQGEVSVYSPFIYDLKEGETAELKLGSVRTDSKKLSNKEIGLEIDDYKLTVTTDYSEKESDFGEDYLGNKEEILVIDLSALNLMFEQGELKISLVYEEEEIISLTTLLNEEIKAKTEEKQIEKSNKTEEQDKIIEELNETKPLVEIVNILTDEERAILLEEFGNLSIETIRQEMFNGRLIIGYKLREYKIEYSYDYSESDEILELQMQADRIKWLKDIARVLSQEASVSEPIGGIVDDSYSIA